LIIMEENEMNKLSKTNSLKVVHQESTSIVKAYNNTIKVRDVEADNKPFWVKMRQTFSKCSLMLGAKAAPTDEEYFILKDVMIESFKDFGADEVEIAFKSLIAGKLDCEPDKYGKISAAYLGQVLIAYRTHRHKALADELKKQPKVEVKASDEVKKERRKAFLENCLFKPYDEIKKLGKFNVDLHISLQLWDVFFRAELVSMTEEQGDEYIEKAKQSLKVDASRDFHAFKPMKKHMEGVRDAIAGNNGDYAKKVMNRARALYMIDYIKSLHDKNRDIRKIAERL
jgi:hypothetical protein